MLLMMPWKPIGIVDAYADPPKLGWSTAPSATLNTGSTSPRMPEIWCTTFPLQVKQVQEYTIPPTPLLWQDIFLVVPV